MNLIILCIAVRFINSLMCVTYIELPKLSLTVQPAQVVMDGEFVSIYNYSPCLLHKFLSVYCIVYNYVDRYYI